VRFILETCSLCFFIFGILLYITLSVFVIVICQLYHFVGVIEVYPSLLSRTYQMGGSIKNYVEFIYTICHEI
jgi:hypothetical protein